MTDAEEAGRLLLDPMTYLDEPLLYRASAVLRVEDPVHWITHPDYPPTTILTRHADVVAVAKDNTAMAPQHTAGAQDV